MPNYIKNRIELIGDETQISEMLKKFSTHFEREPNRASDDSLIYKKVGEEYGVGWLNEDTGKFTKMDKSVVNEIPIDFQQDFNEAWIRFPDFEKVVPMPESLHINSGSNGDMGYSILHGKSENCFMDMGEQLRRFYERDIKERICILEEGIAYEKNMIEYGFKTWYDWSIANWGTKWNSSDCEKISENTFDFTTAWSGVPSIIEKISFQFPDITFLYYYSDENTGYNCGIGKYQNGEIEFTQVENESEEAYELYFTLHPDDVKNYKLVDGVYEYIEEE
ncbi:MAG: hypothetical protein WC827_03550 [Candidatus Paceibacterota bacterium]|jgi:hypothetical protein